MDALHVEIRPLGFKLLARRARPVSADLAFTSALRPLRRAVAAVPVLTNSEVFHAVDELLEREQDWEGRHC